MTSAEFAAIYKVLKTLTERGARSQIAQEVALGRMVMVHHLDVGSAAERQRLRALVNALQPAAAEQVFAVLDVDGTTVLVTRFLTTFFDLPSWLAENAMPDDAKTLVVAAIPARAPEPPPPPPAPKAEPSFTALFAPPGASASPAAPKPPATPSFTEMFGAVKDSGASAPAPVAPPAAAPAPVPPPVKPAAATPTPGEFTRQFQGLQPPPSPASSPAPPAPPAPVASSPASPAAPSFNPPPAQPAAPAKAGESFTQVFGGMASAPPPVQPSAPAPLPAAPRFDAVIPPQAPMAPRVEVPAPAPPPRKASGDFTQLFDRLQPGAPSATPRAPEPLPPPAPVASAPSAAPTPSWSQPPVPPPSAAPPPTPSWQQPPVAPPTPANAAPAAAGPSEFTRILGRVPPPPENPSAPQMPGAPRAPGYQMPPMPQMPQVPQMPQPPQMNVPMMAMQLPQMQLPQAQLPAAGLTPLNVPQQPAGPPPAATRSHLPLIIALNVVLIGGIAVVLYFVLKH